MWGIKSVLGPHTSAHFPTSSPLPSPHPFPTRQHTSPLTPYTFPHHPLTSPHIFPYLPHTPTHFPTSPPHTPHISSHSSLLTSPYIPTHFPYSSPCTLPYLSPHILPNSFVVAKLRSNSKSPIKFFTATGKSCFGGQCKYESVAKLPCGEVTGNPYASPHQPFSTMFWMNEVFP